jgi:uncharacterized coiled-coil protein SlyX
MERGYLGLIETILICKRDEDLLPVRECDKIAIDEVVASIGNREGKVLEMRFGLRGQAISTQKNIGKIFGISGGRVGQIEKKALKLLQHFKRRVFFERFYRSVLEETVSNQEKTINDLKDELKFFKRIIEEHGRANRLNEKMNSLKINSLDEVPVDDMPFSVRTSRCLRENGIMNLGQLMLKTKKDILAIHGFGRHSFCELVDYLQLEWELELTGETINK